MRDLLLKQYGVSLGMEIRVAGVESEGRYYCVAFE